MSARLRAATLGALVGLAGSIREYAMDRPGLRRVLRVIGHPILLGLHRAGGRLPAPAMTDPKGEPVLHLPLDYASGVLAEPPKIAVLLHAYEPAVLPEIIAHLRNIPYPADIFISTDTEAKRLACAAAFFDWPRRTEIRVLPNRGRNIAPQITGFRDVLGRYQLVLFLHTKLSTHTDALAGWRKFLLDNLLGSPDLVRGVVEAFTRLPNLGVLAPRTFAAVRPHMVWGDNFAASRDLAERLGVALSPDSPLDFPAGAMFWARTAALKPLLDLDLTVEDFDPEAGQKDGTLAHAVERLIFYACELAGLRWARAGHAGGLSAPETLIRASAPAMLRRCLTDGGRAVLLPGRRPKPAFGLDRYVLETPDERKAGFRSQCQTELDAFLASGERLVLPTQDAPVVSVLLVLFNQAELTYQALRALKFTLDVPAEVIIVDNASSDQTGGLLNRIDGARIVRNVENKHFLRAANQAARMAKGRYLLFLNNDARTMPGAVAHAAARLDAEPDLGAIGGKILLLDGTLQEAGSIVWRDGACAGFGRGDDPFAPEFQFRRDVDYVSGAFLMTPRAVFEALEGFDRAFAPAYYEETDYCLRLWASGRRVAYDPAIEIAHFEFASSSAASGQALQARNRKLFVAKHAEALARQRDHAARRLDARMRDDWGGRLLIIEDQVPNPQLGAGHPRAVDLLRAARSASWFVTLYPLVYADADYETAYEFLPPDVEIAAERGQAGLVQFLRERAGYYDAVIVSRPHNMELFLQALSQAPTFIARERVIYDAEAIFAVRDSSGDPSRALKAELDLARAARMVLTVSAAEAQAFREGGARDVRVLGHALRADPTASAFEDRRDLLFVGALDDDYGPNADSLAYFVEEIMPLLDKRIGGDWRLKVAGHAAGRARSLAGPRVQVLGRVDDLRPLYDQARVFIAPTRFAAGIPMKIHGAAAAGLPVAATGLLAGQLGWSDGREMLVGDTADAFAAACAQLYTDGAVWRAVRAAALARLARDTDPQVFERTIADALRVTKTR
ncbi:rhamnan synthesis F family protein [Phenylobacterium immobile]|uniref:rhamnan synthesis F family protein n=1 Tax=Phenylobacterium immobile TaxID=21 RepID=UPI000A5CCC8A|nr:rhamnan synthesis F family protein [Phenylobacterium immobile]